MTSPSISSTSRMTPCAAGCCGPKFIVKLRICGAPASSPPGSPAGGGTAKLSGPGRSRLAPGGRFLGPGRLFVAGQDPVHAFPGRHEVEAPEFLLQRERLIDDGLL